MTERENGRQDRTRDRERLQQKQSPNPLHYYTHDLHVNVRHGDKNLHMYT